MSIETRLNKLEQTLGKGDTHQVIFVSGEETQEQARAKYEREVRPIRAKDKVNYSEISIILTND